MLQTTPQTVQATPAAKQADEPTPAPASAPSVAPAEPAGPLSPLVRKMARENNLDLTKVKGTGAGGRITKQDVEAYMAQGPAAAAPATPAPVPPPAADGGTACVARGPMAGGWEVRSDYRTGMALCE